MGLFLVCGAIACEAQGFGGQRSPAPYNGCILDHCQDRPDLAQPGTPGNTPAAPLPGPGPANNAGGPIAPGNFDFYVLALSWAPGFCATAGAAKGGDECAAGARLGFVVHGLWPQFEHGFPSDCDGPRTPSQSALALTRGLYPDVGLARYEWRKHGTCTGEAATAYFNDVRRARALITVPPSLEAPQTEQRISAADMQRAFIAANQRLRPGMMATICTRGVLEEVRLCLSKDLRDFRPCPEVVRDTCRSGSMSVPPIE